MPLSVPKSRLCRSLSRLVLRESQGRSLPRLLRVPRGLRAYYSDSPNFLSLSYGGGRKDCSAPMLMAGRPAGELIFTRRPHFYIVKKKK